MKRFFIGFGVGVASAAIMASLIPTLRPPRGPVEWSVLLVLLVGGTAIGYGAPGLPRRVGVWFGAGVVAFATVLLGGTSLVWTLGVGNESSLSVVVAFLAACVAATVFRLAHRRGAW